MNGRGSGGEGGGDQVADLRTQGMRAPGTTLYVLCGLQEGIQLDLT